MSVPRNIHLARVAPFSVPENLARSATTDAGMRAWTSYAEQRVREVAADWSLDVGPAFEPGGQTAWVAPARAADGADVVLKVGRWHEEAEHEAEALRLWDGHGAVRLLRHERREDTVCLLIERCEPGTALRGRPQGSRTR